MTENEIIEILQTEKACVTRAMKNECNRDCYNCDLCEEGKDILTVYDSVINALEERERYRAIGTIEELQELKEKIQGYKNQMSIYAEQHKVILANDVLDMLEELDWQ